MRREAVNHSVGGCVRGMAHTNGMESFRSMRRRGHHGTFRHFSPEHRQRCVNESAVRQGLRERDAIDDRMVASAHGMAGKRLRHVGLTG